MNLDYFLFKIFRATCISGDYVEDKIEIISKLKKSLLKE